MSLKIRIPADPVDVFQFVSNPLNVSYLMQDSFSVEVLNAPRQLVSDSECTFLMTRFGVRQRIRFRALEVGPGTRLVYQQEEGVFRKWVHTIETVADPDGGCQLCEKVDYQLPLGILGLLLDDLHFTADLKRVANLRQQRALDFFTRLSKQLPLTDAGDAV